MKESSFDRGFRFVAFTATGGIVLLLGFASNRPPRRLWRPLKFSSLAWYWLALGNGMLLKGVLMSELTVC